jgi:hypothetical protein
MDELTKVWQVLDRTKINKLECETHKNARANRVKLCKRTTRKLRAAKKCSKSSVVVALCLLPTENEFEKNC